MRQQTSAEPSWKGRRFRVVAVNTNEQSKRIRSAVARRAFEIFERGGSVPGHDLENWQRAESELVSPLLCGLIALDDRVSLNTDASAFEPGVIEICVEASRLTICGKPAGAGNGRAQGATDPASRQELVFRVVDLPAGVDQSQVTAKFNGRILEIDLPSVKNARRLGRCVGF